MKKKSNLISKFSIITLMFSKPTGETSDSESYLVILKLSNLDEIAIELLK